MYKIFLIISKARNTGHDGKGEQCGLNDIYKNHSVRKTQSK